MRAFPTIAGSTLGALGVLLGAFGAHALRGQLDARGVELWHTATLYLFVHALALFAVPAHRSRVGAGAESSERVDGGSNRRVGTGVADGDESAGAAVSERPLHPRRARRAATIAAIAFALGCVLFSGSLYALALGAPTALGIATPFGGVAFAVGWIALGVARH